MITDKAIEQIDLIIDSTERSLDIWRTKRSKLLRRKAKALQSKRLKLWEETERIGFLCRQGPDTIDYNIVIDSHCPLEDKLTVLEVTKIFSVSTYVGQITFPILHTDNATHLEVDAMRDRGAQSVFSSLKDNILIWGKYDHLL